jgi:hypothetical protein
LVARTNELSLCRVPRRSDITAWNLNLYVWVCNSRFNSGASSLNLVKARLIQGIEVLSSLVKLGLLLNGYIINILTGAAAGSPSGANSALNTLDEFSSFWINFCEGIVTIVTLSRAGS